VKKLFLLGWKMRGNSQKKLFKKKIGGSKI